MDTAERAVLEEGGGVIDGPDEAAGHGGEKAVVEVTPAPVVEGPGAGVAEEELEADALGGKRGLDVLEQALGRGDGGGVRLFDRGESGGGAVLVAPGEGGVVRVGGVDVGGVGANGEGETAVLQVKIGDGSFLGFAGAEAGAGGGFGDEFWEELADGGPLDAELDAVEEVEGRDGGEGEGAEAGGGEGLDAVAGAVGDFGGGFDDVGELVLEPRVAGEAGEKGEAEEAV